MAYVGKNNRSPYYQAYYQAKRDGRWRKVSRSTRETDKSAALSKARKWEREEQVSADEATINNVVRRVLWEEYAGSWVTRRAERVSENTMVSYRRGIDLFSKWLGRPIMMDEIDLAMVEAYYLEHIEEGMRPSSMTLYLSVLGQIFKRAVAEGVMLRNPVIGVERVRGKRNRKDPFTIEEVHALLDACEKAHPPKLAAQWRTMILGGFCTGQRLRDVAGMSFDGMADAPSGRVITFVPRKKERFDRPVTLPIIDPLRSHLESMDRSAGPWCPDLVGKGSAHLSYQFRKIMSEAGIVIEIDEKKGPRGVAFKSKGFHSFRHMLHSRLETAGVPEEWRMKILDHDSRQIHERYRHTEMDAIAGWMERIELGLNEITKKD